MKNRSVVPDVPSSMAVTIDFSKFILITFVLFLGFVFQSKAVPTVMEVSISGCVGENNLYRLVGASCTGVVWIVAGNYQVISQNSVEITVKWNTPNANAFVQANFSGCSGSPTSGTAFSPSHNVTTPVAPSVSITSNNNVCSLTLITFQAVPTNGGTAPFYAWKVNGSPAPGSTNSPTYSTFALTSGQVVTCQMTSNLPCVTGAPTSNAITMVLTTPSPASVSINATTLPWCNGVGSFTATPVNVGASPVYTWYKNNVQATDNQTGLPAYVYAPIGSLGEGVVVKCVMTSSLGCVSPNPVTSNEITVTVTTPIVPTVNIVPTPSSVCDGSNITFTASSPQTGYTLSTYSWTMNGIPVGTNSTPYTTNQLTPTSTIGLTANFAGSCIAPNSKTVSLSGVTVKPVPSTAITPSGPLKICSNCSQLINASPTGAGYSYVWKKDGVVIAGAITSSYNTSTAGTYLAEVTLNGCPKTAPTALVLTKNVAPVSNAGVDKVLTLPTNTVTLSGSGSDGDGSISTYLWSKISGVFGSMSGEATATLVLTNLSGGNHVYRLTVTDNFGETKTDDVNITVNAVLNDYNRIQTTTVLVPAKTTESQVTSLTIGPKQVVNQYFDGLGRVMQTVTNQGSPAALDLVQPVVYNAYEREVKKYLPFSAGNNGYYQPNESIIDAAGNYAGAAQPFYLPASNNKIADDTRPYVETIFETSPLNRPLKEYGAGQDWLNSSKFVEHKFLNNVHGTAAGQEKIISWKISGGMPVRSAVLTGYVEAGGYYSSNQLFIKVSVDEQLNVVREYTNKKGQIILKKVQAVAGSTNLTSVTDWALTYYIYDEFGNIRYVFQPELSRQLHQNADTYVVNTTDLANWAFQYKYDLRNRVSEKRVPGSDWVYIVYDNRDRVVLTQDGNQRAGATNVIKYWTFTKYDELNRPIATGIKDTTTTVQLTQAQMQSVVNTYYSLIPTTKPWRRSGEQYVGNVAGNVHGYTNKSYPVVTSAVTVNVQSYLTITYYDNYGFLSLWTGDYLYKYDSLSQVENGATYTQSATEFKRVLGKVSGTKAKVMSGGITGGTVWLNSINYYDENHRVVQVQSDNYRGGKDRISNLYNFGGQVLKSKSTHVRIVGAPMKIVRRRMEYDLGGRLIRIWHQVGSLTEFLLVHNTYNELGQLVDKKLHSTTAGATDAKQSADYRYNIRGWLTSMNNSQLSNDGVVNDDTGDFWGMNLGYNTDVGVLNAALYNGNISAMKWSNYLGQGIVKEKSHTFGYDAMNRITAATFKEKIISGWNAATNNGFSEPVYTYDLNGNIKTLTRHDKRGTTGVMDNLVYDYGAAAAQSNRLLSVTDSGDDFTGFVDGATGTDYTYDANGNMITDQNKGITSAISYNFLNLPELVTRGGNTIRYVYDANGQKLAQVVTFAGSVKQTDYVGEYIYENDVLQFINHEEGRIVMSANKVVVSDAGESLSTITPVNSNRALYTANGEQYISVAAVGTAQRTGIWVLPPGGTLTVQPGQRYLIRTKGYRAGSNPVYISIKANGTTDLNWPGAALPSSAVTEAWVEQTVTIPAGTATLQTGLAWNTTVANGEQFYMNGFEVIQLTTLTPEYQYHLKDHLGNVRLTFTAKTQTPLSYTASFESGTQTTEQSNFVNYSSTTFDLVDHTDAGGTTYQKVQLLNGGASGRVGLSKSISVMPGDQITASAWCKYMNLGTTGNPTSFITALAGVFGVSGGSVGDQLKLYTGLNSYASTIPGGEHVGDNDGLPKAFVTILFFDRNYKLINAAWDQVGAAGAQTSATVKQPPHDLLTITATASEPGYAYIFLSNEHPNYVDVYFDDVNFSYTPSAIVSTSDYYPFGLTFNSHQRENSVPNKRLYNDGSEIQDALNLNVYQTQFRILDQALGRWWQIDSKADSLEILTPFSYSFNNPIRYNDPKGDCPPNDPGCAGRGGMSPVRAALQSNVGGNLRAAGNSASNIISGTVGVQAAGIGAKVKIAGVVHLEATGKAGVGEISYSNSDGIGASASVASTEFGLRLGPLGGTASSTNMTYDGESFYLIDQSGSFNAGSVQYGHTANEIGIGATLGNLSAEISANLDAVGDAINSTVKAVKSYFQNLLPTDL